jgi:hypothetical protein
VGNDSKVENTQVQGEALELGRIDRLAVGFSKASRGHLSIKLMTNNVYSRGRDVQQGASGCTEMKTLDPASRWKEGTGVTENECKQGTQ